MLRLAQLLIVVTTGSAESAHACFEALETERDAVKGPAMFEGFMLSKLLIQERTGELFPEWLDLLLRLDSLINTEPKLAAVAASFRTEGEGSPDGIGVLFAGLIRGITTVRAFRYLMERLDGVSSNLRERLFSAFEPGRGDIRIMVNHGWMKESRTDTFD